MGAPLVEPVLAPLIRSAALCRTLAILGVAILVSTSLRLAIIQCPMMQALGWPCPGCGLSRSAAAFLRGDLHTAVRYHAFGPLFATVVAVLAIASVLSESSRLALADLVARVERRSLFMQISLSVVLVYWCSRLGYAADELRVMLTTIK